MMTIANTDFLPRILAADAALSAVAGIAAAAGAGILGPFLGLPTGLLFWAGLILLPWAAFLFVLSRRSDPSRALVIDVVIVNAAWVAASVGLLAGGFVQPNALGVAFVLAQAAALAVLAILQVGGLRRLSMAAT